MKGGTEHLHPPASIAAGSKEESLADRWLRCVKNNKLIAVLIVTFFLIGLIRTAIDALQYAAQLTHEYSKPLKIDQPIAAIHEPWFYLIFPNPQKPVPMWLTFYVTLHNTSHQSVWISYYSATAKTRDKWIQLSLPRQAIDKYTLFFPAQGYMSALKPEDDFSYNAAKTAVPADGYLSGWMFFESRIDDNISRLEFEFHDKDGKLHRVQVGAFNAGFGGEPAKSTPSSFVSHTFHYEDNAPPLSSQLQEYMKGMYSYISLYPAMHPKP
jgi:hypothetical protein